MDIATTTPHVNVRWVTRIIDGLTRAHARIQDVERRQQAQLLATIQVVFIVLLICLLPIFIVQSEPDPSVINTTQNLLVTRFILFVIVLTSISYLVNRGGYYTASALLFVAQLFLIIVIIPIFTVDTVIFTLPSLFLVTSILLPFRGLLLVMALAFATSLASNILVPPLTVPLFTIADVRTLGFTYGLLNVGFLLTFIRYRNRLEAKRQAELRAANNELQQYRIIVETAQEGIWLRDNDDKTIYVNPRMDNILGYDSKDAPRQPVQQFLVDPEQLKIRPGENPRRQVEMQLKNKSGQMIWALVTTNDLLNVQGDRTGTLAMITDITARKQAEIEREKLIQELRIATDQAQESNRLKSEFLSTMSHELRTPLNAIEGFTGIMLGNMGIELNARARDMVTRISINSKRLLQLINDFLDLSRIESGRLELVSEPFSPVELAHRWRDQVGVMGLKKGLAFDVIIAPELPATLYGDEDALTKIGINLLSNAFKFTQQGTVTLKMGCDQATWSIEVSDTGIGIPIHAREYIFDEFRQVDGSSRRVYGGTGLGLAIVQKLARSMQGTVTLKSEVGVGSTFIVTLPLQTSPIAVGAATP